MPCMGLVSVEEYLEALPGLSLGVPAFASVILIFRLMVAKP